MKARQQFAAGFQEGWAQARSPDFLPFLNATVLFAAGLATLVAIAG